MTIFPVSYGQLLDSLEMEALLAEYAAECSLPELGVISPQRELYAAMEASGGMQCFAAYTDDLTTLVGFVTVLIYVLPHYGRRIATTESIFLSHKHRIGGAGMELLAFVEAHAREKGCAAVLYTAPEGSRFSALLSMRESCRHSNNVFVMAL